MNLDGDDCEDKMNKVELKTICKSGYVNLKMAKHFNITNTAYYAAEAKRPDKIYDTECFIVYMDITNLYPDCTEYINALDWSKIYLSIQPNPNPTAVTTSTTGGTPQIDINHLVVAMDQQYKDTLDLKEGTLIVYDLATGKGVPTECISRHDMYNKTNNIMTKLEMPKIKNPLTPNKHNIPQ